MQPLTVVIETPRGSAEKYDYIPEQKAFKLHKMTPAGMVFPYDFGFIPDTKGKMKTHWISWFYPVLKPFLVAWLIAA